MHTSKWTRRSEHVLERYTLFSDLFSTFYKAYKYSPQKNPKQTCCQQNVFAAKVSVFSYKNINRSINRDSFFFPTEEVKCCTVGSKLDKIQTQIQVTENGTSVIFISQPNLSLVWGFPPLLGPSLVLIALGRSDFIIWSVEGFGNQSQISNEQTLGLFFSQLKV